MSTPFSQALTLYTWTLVVLAVGVVLLIARFYAKSAGQQTRYWLFGVPIFFFAAGALRHLAAGRSVGDALGGGMWFLGAVTQIALCLVLYKQMTSD